MSDIKKKEKIYQGCFTRNKDGTNKLIEKGKGCICPIFGNIQKRQTVLLKHALKKETNKKLPSKNLISTLKKNILTDG